MLSAETISKLDALYGVQSDYRPNDNIQECLTEKTMVMFVGATCVGKNTVMEALETQDNRFQVCGTRTTREPRDNDDETRYVYHTNTDENLARITAKIEARQVVQYAVNPYSKLLYWSEIEDYDAPNNIGDIFAGAVSGFRQLGFKASPAITIVSDPAVWLERFDERFPLGHPQRQARRDEAVESFTWSLDQTAGHFWIENVAGQPEIAAQVAIDAVLHGGIGQPGARSLAEASLKIARQIGL